MTNDKEPQMSLEEAKRLLKQWKDRGDMILYYTTHSYEYGCRLLEAQDLVSREEERKRWIELLEETLEGWEGNFWFTQSEYETHSNSQSFDNEHQRIEEIKQQILHPNQ